MSRSAAVKAGQGVAGKLTRDVLGIEGEVVNVVGRGGRVVVVPAGRRFRLRLRASVSHPVKSSAPDSLAGCMVLACWGYSCS